MHHVRWDMTPDQVERFAAGAVTLVADHPAYAAETPLADDTVAELAADLRSGG